jgi:hypothetical protein
LVYPESDTTCRDPLFNVGAQIKRRGLFYSILPTFAVAIVIEILGGADHRHHGGCINFTKVQAIRHMPLAHFLKILKRQNVIFMKFKQALSLWFLKLLGIELRTAEKENIQTPRAPVCRSAATCSAHCCLFAGRLVASLGQASTRIIPASEMTAASLAFWLVNAC